MKVAMEKMMMLIVLNAIQICIDIYYHPLDLQNAFAILVTLIN